MINKRVLITGANSGIGKATASGLAKLGAQVVMVCRDRERGEAARDEIINHSGNQDVVLMLTDLASQTAIHKLADEYKKSFQTLDVLINNAGLAKKEYTTTPDGLETTFAVNHLAPFLLTNLMLDMLKASAPSRIINVSSMVHKWGEINFEDLIEKGKYDMDRAYNQSKLANVLFTYELARRLDGSGVTVNSLEPGMVRTDFGREYTGFKGFMNRAWRVFMKTPERGAETPIYLASAPELERVSGKYFSNNRPVRSSEASYDEELARKLWHSSAKFTHLSTAK